MAGGAGKGGSGHSNAALNSDEDIMNRLRRNFKSWAGGRHQNRRSNVVINYDKSPKPKNKG